MWNFLGKWIFHKLLKYGTTERLWNSSNTVKDYLVFQKPQFNLWATQLWQDDKQSQLLQLLAEFLLTSYVKEIENAKY